MTLAAQLMLRMMRAGELVDQRRHPARASSCDRRCSGASPARAASSSRLQADRLAEVDVHAGRSARAADAGCAAASTNALLLLRPAGQLADVGGALTSSARSRNTPARTPPGRRGSRRKLRTVIDSMPVAGSSSRPVRLRPPSMKYSIECPRAMIARQVLAEHHRIERVAAEAAAHEERAALAQEPARSPAC